MGKVLVVISGLPGKMASLMAKAVKDSAEFELGEVAFTGPEIGQDFAGCIKLIRPEQREVWIERLGDRRFFVVDFSHPDAVVPNAEFYCKHGLPFVMGTTGGDRKRLGEIVATSDIPAVIAPNMAAQVVAVQTAMECMATTFPGAFAGFELAVRESHQKGKADTSGTAKAIIACFKRLGISFDVDQIEMVRDPGKQLAMDIPKEYLDGHGVHTYVWTSPDGTMSFRLDHNIFGRDPYVAGTMKALAFLAKQVEAGVKGKVFSMTDVLKAG